MHCNGCWNEDQPKEHRVVTTCGHLYCLSCTQAIIESDDPTCPICSQVMTKQNVKAVPGPVLSAAESASLNLTLCGQTPDVAMSVAMASIQFFTQQQDLYAQLQLQQTQRKIEKTQDQCRKKLTEVHNGYLTAKRKYQELQQARQALLEDNKELQEKYNQKAQQDKKLKDAFALLQQENESLRRANEQLVQRMHGGGGGMQMNVPPTFTSGGGFAGGNRAPARAGNFSDVDDDMGLRMDHNSRRKSLGGGMGRPQLKEHSPLQSPNFNPKNPFSFETPSNPPVLRNVLKTAQFPGSASKPLSMNMNRRASFLNPNSPSGMASL